MYTAFRLTWLVTKCRATGTSGKLVFSCLACTDDGCLRPATALSDDTASPEIIQQIKRPTKYNYGFLHKA